MGFYNIDKLEQLKKFDIDIYINNSLVANPSMKVLNYTKNRHYQSKNLLYIEKADLNDSIAILIEQNNEIGLITPKEFKKQFESKVFHARSIKLDDEQEMSFEERLEAFLRE
jgi:hypothetical protein